MRFDYKKKLFVVAVFVSIILLGFGIALFKTVQIVKKNKEILGVDYSQELFNAQSLFAISDKLLPLARNLLFTGDKPQKDKYQESVDFFDGELDRINATITTPQVRSFTQQLEETTGEYKSILERALKLKKDRKADAAYRFFETEIQSRREDLVIKLDELADFKKGYWEKGISKVVVDAFIFCFSDFDNGLEPVASNLLAIL